MPSRLNKPVSHGGKKILFLGYNRDTTRVIDSLIKIGCEVWQTSDKIETLSGYDFVISFGYKYILTQDLINTSTHPIINLHISYLPWNRGAHPNFWSFYDNTPSGVSIHLIDKGIDTGPILFQKHVIFPKNCDTFRKSYKILINEIENLFICNMVNILTKNYKIYPQKHQGTFHFIKDLPEQFNGWDSIITEEIARLHNSKTSC